jgi:kynurenine---oxoglutarate transaminase / cysteine-S-conjugate beta-lyase / glutamine---phenylpyruvate transaminase
MTIAASLLLSTYTKFGASALLRSKQRAPPTHQCIRLLSTRHALAPRLDGLDKPTVWHEFSPLANEHKAINLGQGFPDWSPPDFCVQALQASVTTRNANQYARSYAHMPLAQVLAKEYADRWGIDIDPSTMVGTAVGCTNALYCALQGLVAPGDEVLLLEPAFDIYHAQVKMAGGVPTYVPLRPTGTGK